MQCAVDFALMEPYSRRMAWWSTGVPLKGSPGVVWSPTDMSSSPVYNMALLYVTWHTGSDCNAFVPPTDSSGLSQLKLLWPYPGFRCLHAQARGQGAVGVLRALPGLQPQDGCRRGHPAEVRTQALAPGLLAYMLLPQHAGPESSFRILGFGIAADCCVCTYSRL